MSNCSLLSSICFSDLLRFLNFLMLTLPEEMGPEEQFSSDLMFCVVCVQSQTCFAFDFNDQITTSPMARHLLPFCRHQQNVLSEVLELDSPAVAFT